MPECKGFSAWISIEGSVATEYSTRILKELDKAECWIASKEGKHFEIQFSALEALPISSARLKRRVVARFFVDGVYVGSKWCCQPPSTGTFDSIRISLAQRRKLIFSTLTLSDDERYKGVPPDAAYGTIWVEVWEVETTGSRAKRFIPIMPSQTVHETAKKVGGHCVGLGEASTRDTGRSVISPKYHRIKKLVTFSFSYQPLDLLQAKGIAPRPTREIATTNPITPPPSIPEAPAGDDDNESTDEECKFIHDQITQLKARLDALSDRRKNRKRNHTAVKQDDSNVPGPSKRATKKVKLENAKEAPKLQPGEVIDLTID
ncbi:hypothetical protein ONZ45_g15974 [Pleurotus djamor]|nr:hypothetical protein ONZ45_g15974 [Pleurotus djamor]